MGSCIHSKPIEPDYTDELFSQQSDTTACINFYNNCEFTVWVLYTLGSPPTIEYIDTLSPQCRVQYGIFQSKMSAGRIYFYYRNPSEFIPEWPYDIGKIYPSVSQDYCQLTEMTLDCSNEKSFWDYDISYVDRASLPIYMLAPGSDDTNCKKCYATGDPKTFTDGCPTMVINYDPISQCSQAVGAYSYCTDYPEHADEPFCHVLDLYKDMLDVKYQNKVTPTLYGGNDPTLASEKYEAINRGICLSVVQCPLVPDKDDPSTWYSSQLPQNEYAAWLNEKGKNIYKFSLDEGKYGGNSQCRFSTRLDIVINP
jgi:hypothetical protein